MVHATEGPVQREINSIRAMVMKMHDVDSGMNVLVRAVRRGFTGANKRIPSQRNDGNARRIHMPAAVPWQQHRICVAFGPFTRDFCRSSKEISSILNSNITQRNIL
jgi:hypothetical protein